MIDVSRRQAKVRESIVSAEYIMKLEAAEAKLQELRSNVATMGKEAAAAMAAVEGQQQRLTLQRLISMVDLLFNNKIFFIIFSSDACRTWNPYFDGNYIIILSIIFVNEG